MGHYASEMYDPRDDWNKAREIIVDGKVVKSNYELNSHRQPADRAGEERTFADKQAAVTALTNEIIDEVKLAMIKHAPMHSPHEGISVLKEEVDELWDHVKADTGRTPPARLEAKQIAAMAIRYIVDLIDAS